MRLSRRFYGMSRKGGGRVSRERAFSRECQTLWDLPTESCKTLTVSGYLLVVYFTCTCMHGSWALGTLGHRIQNKIACELVQSEMNGLYRAV